MINSTMRHQHHYCARLCRALKPIILSVSLLLSACVTTNSAPEIDKWLPEKRAQAHVSLGMIYLRANQLDTAEAEFTMALQTDPTLSNAHHSMGLLLSRKKKNSEATTFFKKAAKLDPENFLAVNDYAIHLCQNGNGVSGVKKLKKIEFNPENDELLGTQLGLGICYFELKDDNLASIYLRMVLNQSPYIPLALYRMGDISFRQEIYLSARAFVERYFATSAVSDGALFLGAKVEIKLGDINKAKQYKRELQKRYPNSALNKKLESILG